VGRFFAQRQDSAASLLIIIFYASSIVCIRTVGCDKGLLPSTNSITSLAFASFLLTQRAPSSRRVHRDLVKNYTFVLLFAFCKVERDVGGIAKNLYLCGLCVNLALSALNK
jgi:uncharacterized membrane protein